MPTPTIAYARPHPGESPEAAALQTERIVAANSRRGPVVLRVEPTPHSLDALALVLDDLAAHPGPDRLVVGRDYATFGVGEPDGRYDAAHDAWHRTGGGQLVTRNVSIETGEECTGDCTTWRVLHEQQLESTETARRVEVLRRLRRGGAG